MAVKISNWIFLIICVLSAAVQYNDPDALLWASMYLFAAAMCIVQIHKGKPRWLPPALLVIGLAWIALAMHQQRVDGAILINDKFNFHVLPASRSPEAGGAQWLHHIRAVHGY